jgi:hypothetical protein
LTASWSSYSSSAPAFEAGGQGGQAPRGDHDPPGAGEILERPQRGDRDALDARQDHDPVAEVAEGQRAAVDMAASLEQLVVEEIQVVARLQDPADDVAPEDLRDGVVHGDPAGRFSRRPGVGCMAWNQGNAIRPAGLLSPRD